MRGSRVKSNREGQEREWATARSKGGGNNEVRERKCV